MPSLFPNMALLRGEELALARSVRKAPSIRVKSAQLCWSPLVIDRNLAQGVSDASFDGTNPPLQLD